MKKINAPHHKDSSSTILDLAQQLNVEASSNLIQSAHMLLSAISIANRCKSAEIHVFLAFFKKIAELNNITKTDNHGH